MWFDQFKVYVIMTWWCLYLQHFFQEDIIAIIPCAFRKQFTVDMHAIGRGQALPITVYIAQHSDKVCFHPVFIGLHFESIRDVFECVVAATHSQYAGDFTVILDHSPCVGIRVSEQHNFGFIFVAVAHPSQLFLELFAGDYVHYVLEWAALYWFVGPEPLVCQSQCRHTGENEGEDFFHIFVGDV